MIQTIPGRIPDLLKELDRRRQQEESAAAESLTMPAPAGPPSAASEPPSQESPAAAPSPPSGILPGEEQVQTMDTFRQLTPVQQDAMRRLHKQHSPARDFEEWMAEAYGDETPPNRLAAMQERSGTVPVAQAAGVDVLPDPTLPPGARSQLAGQRVQSGKPLPEGRDPSQYSPQQWRTMNRNIHAPDVPMREFGGTFTVNGDGAMSARAPDPALMAAAEQAKAKDGEYSMPHIVALGHAYGIDVARYGDDLDLLRADVDREERRHKSLSQKYDVVKTPMGGYRYTPNFSTRSAGLAQDRKRFASRINKQYAGMGGDSPDAGLVGNQGGEFADRTRALANAPEVASAMSRLEAARGTADPATIAAAEADVLRAHQAAMAQMRDRNEALRERFNENAVRTQRGRLQNEILTRDMNNPRTREGLYIRSLREAKNAAERGTINDAFGNQIAAAGERQLAAQEAAAESALEQKRREDEIAERNKPNPARDMEKVMRDALAQPAGPLQRSAVKAALIGAGMATPENADKEADRVIADHEASRNPSGETAKKRLHQLAWSGDWEGFMRVATMMNLSDPQAKAFWEQSRPLATAWDQMWRGSSPSAWTAAPPMTAGPSSPPGASRGK
jgi:hypothetical protein